MWTHEISHREAFEYIRCRFAPPPFPGEQNRICSSGILWMYFDFVYGILFDGRIITRKTRKSHRNTENKKNRLDENYVVPSPVPHTEPTEINGIHEKGDRGGVSR